MEALIQSRLTLCSMGPHYIAAWPRPTVATDPHIASAWVMLSEFWWAATKGHDLDAQNKLRVTMKACSDSTSVDRGTKALGLGLSPRSPTSLQV